MRPLKKRPGLNSCDGLLGLLAKPKDFLFVGVGFNIGWYPFILALIENSPLAFVGGE